MLAAEHRIGHGLVDAAIAGNGTTQQIEGIGAIIRKFGLAGLAIASQSDVSSVKSVSIAALLLAAYEDRDSAAAIAALSNHLETAREAVLERLA